MLAMWLFAHPRQLCSCCSYVAAMSTPLFLCTHPDCSIDRVLSTRMYACMHVCLLVCAYVFNVFASVFPLRRRRQAVPWIGSNVHARWSQPYLRLQQQQRRAVRFFIFLLSPLFSPLYPNSFFLFISIICFALKNGRTVSARAQTNE
jgi:hypothetical protein